MRNMSFMLTTEQIRNETKSVTRRAGWVNLKAGDLICAVEKCQGLRAGEKLNRLKTIKVVSVRREPLRAMTDDPEYGLAECVKEGFGDHPSLQWPSEFVPFFCNSHRGCTPETEVTRIEFVYVAPASQASHHAARP